MSSTCLCVLCFTSIYSVHRYVFNIFLTTNSQSSQKCIKTMFPMCLCVLKFFQNSKFHVTLGIIGNNETCLTLILKSPFKKSPLLSTYIKNGLARL